ncbi:hypothetical protein GH5_06602 [Leishmania sp. Ghana 2012 LV757]|uniref:hypothetical protein n=1 Tax=Leishmania sp. Ghana 2012 LV757 TaxID=2803181 RepID=UPI001B44BA7D|nr:hypothetical protein GH5_06602 [Leishmania sp. Ghana 2012 LV757]
MKKRCMESICAGAVMIQHASEKNHRRLHAGTPYSVQHSRHVSGVVGGSGLNRRVPPVSTTVLCHSSLSSPSSSGGVPYAAALWLPRVVKSSTRPCTTSTLVPSASALRSLAVGHLADALTGRRALSTSTSSSGSTKEVSAPAAAKGSHESIAALATGDTAGTSNTPVDPALLAEIRATLERQVDKTWLPVSDLYAALPLRMRRSYVKPHKSLTHVLQKCAHELGISLSITGVYYAKGNMPSGATPSIDGAPGAAPMDGSADNLSKSSSSSTTKEARTAAVNANADGDNVISAAVQTPSDPSSRPMNATVLEGTCSISKAMGPVDFFFDVGLHEIPNPPRDFDATPSALVVDGTHSSANGSVISLRDFVSHIPPFFVPVKEVVANMPGYTAEHLEVYLNVKPLELVTVAGERYVRLYGSFGYLSLSGSEVSEKRFARYHPNVALVAALEAAFEGTYDRWMPLPELLRRVGPDVAGQLPYHGPAAIIYFAQMQHRFAFAVRQVPTAGVDAEGAPSSPQFSTEAAVLLRKPGYSGLEAHSTPTPKSFQVLINLVPGDKQVDIDVVRCQLTSEVRAELSSYYGGLEGFFAAHKPVFFVPPEMPTVVMRMRYRLRTQRAKLPLEEQLRIAIDARDKGRIRVLRRKIAFRDNPSHPLHDPENLAKELSKHLPRRGFVSLRVFLKRNVPEELVMYMPKRIRSFFNNYPQYFTQFEYQSAGTWCVCRPDQPLPRGVIRQNFNDGDLLRLIAEFLQQRGARAASTIHTNLPFGAQEVIRRRYGGVYFFVIRYPQYFSVVLKTDRDNLKSSAVVHLIQVPTQELSDAAMQASAESSNNPNAPSCGSDDHDDGDDDDDIDDGLD